MTTLLWWLVDLIALSLKPEERGPVHGDLAEAGESGFHAVAGVLGLASRRNWRSLAVIIPLGVWLSFTSRQTAYGSAVYVWLYANNWDSALLANPGFLHEFLAFAGYVSRELLILAAWSCAAGILLGIVSRRTRVTAGLFCLIVLLTGTARDSGPNSAVFSLVFYRIAFPLIVQITLVLAPAILCMHIAPRLLRLLRVPALALACSAFMIAAEQPGARALVIPPQDRKPAPDFALTDSQGKPADLKQYHGKIVLLDFWATWCHGCKQEIPWFVEFHRKYAPQGLAVVGVSLDGDGWKVVKPFLATANIPYRVVLGDDALAARYGIGNMPDTYLIDRQGRIAAVYSGMVDRDNIEANIRAMLAHR